MSNSESEVPEVHGYDAVFEPALDKRYMCPVCLTALREPVQTVCGHRFCRACLYAAMGSRRKGKCPVDNTWFNSTKHIFEDNAVKREVLSLTVRCDKHSEGCEWKGELRTLESHGEECLFAVLSCENCEMEVIRKDLPSHLQTCPRRMETCDLCSVAVVFADLPKHQLLECEKFPVNCVICGETGILREDITKHVDIVDGNCELVTVPCNFFKLGCFFQDKRKNMADHYRMSKAYHQSLCINKITELGTQVNDQNSVIAQMKEELMKCHSVIERQNRVLESHSGQSAGPSHCSGRLLWKVLLSDCNGCKVTSPSFYTGAPGYKVKATFDIHGCVEENVTYSSVSLKLEKGCFDHQLDTRTMLGRCSVFVLNQENFTRSELATQFRCAGQVPRNDGQAVILGNRWKFARLSELMQGVYLKDGFLVLEICVEHLTA